MGISIVVRAVSCILVLVLSILAAQAASKNATDLCLLSMLPYPINYLNEHPTWEDGADIVRAVYLAVDQINNRTDLLEGYKLHLIESNGACNIQPITYVSFVRAMTECKDSSQPIVGIIGPACSASALVVAPLLEHFPTISIHLVSGIALGQYPLSFGIIDSATLYTEAMSELVLFNQWTKVGILFSTTNTKYDAIRQGFSDKVIQNEGYNIDYSIELLHRQLPLQMIRNSSAQIIFTLLSPTMMQQFVCLMYLHNMSFPLYQLVLVDNQLEDLAEIHFQFSGNSYYCSGEEMKKAVEGAVLLFLDLQAANDTQIVSGETYSEYIHHYQASINDYNEKHRTNSTPTDRANPMYDATWALALALNATDSELMLSNLTLLPYNETIARMTRDNLLQQRFIGASGAMSFEQKTHYARREVRIHQMGEGFSHFIGYYGNGEINVTDTAVFLTKDFQIVIETTLSFQVAVAILVILGVALLITFLTQVIAIIYRRYKPIKASSYKLNQLAYVGYYSLTASLAQFVLPEHFILGDGARSTLCASTPTLRNVGVALILGTVCMKSWRLYRIYISSRDLKPIRNPRLLKDTSLAIGVLAIVSVSVAISICRVVVDSAVWSIGGVRQYSSHSIAFTYGCIDAYTVSLWVPLFNGYYILLVLLSLMFTLLARKMERKNFDVKTMMLLVYVLTFSIGFTIPYVIISVLEKDGNALTAGIVHLIVTLYTCMTFLFLPPVIVLFRGKWTGKFYDKSFWSPVPGRKPRRRRLAIREIANPLGNLRK